MQADVIVIGGGMAGCVAALKASERGRNVLLIRKGRGSTAMSSGTFDVAGPNGFLPYDSWEKLPTVADSLGEILRTNPRHPYSVIAGGRNEVERLQSLIRSACSFAFEKIPSLRYEGSFDRNMVLPTVMGTTKYTAFAPASLIGGNLTKMAGAYLMLVGLQGFSHFEPGICRRALIGNSFERRAEASPKIDSIEIDIPGEKGAAGVTPFEAASLFDKTEVCEEFLQSLRRHTEPGVTHVGLPPILGLSKHREAFETIDGGLDARIFELISPTCSTPGHRLQAALDKALGDAGVRLATADVAGVECDGRLIKNLVLEGMKTKRTATAAGYIVATGKFSAGGLRSDDFPEEPLLGLPLYADGKRADDKFLQYLLDWNAEARQMFLSCGIHIDESLHPLDPYGEPAYENLHAAGSIIGEYDYVTEKCGLGVATLTGYLAGEKVSG